MTAPAVDADVIALPPWYAGLSLDGLRAPFANAGGDSIQAGPVSVVRASRGAELASFGSPERPSIAIFDGYLFDRDEVADNLSMPRAASSAEIVAAAYGRWG